MMSMCGSGGEVKILTMTTLLRFYLVDLLCNGSADIMCNDSVLLSAVYVHQSIGALTGSLLPLLLT